ncbi:dTDP-4-dehydrorhamnose reductase [Bradyrhizobium sp. Tv2a-2]|uniref:dTDP-4-dehydrorhamnose reductase n=1 Tax=Bradyrhizobium sp. Tv2a-2 TaxID=113395 RepID=UPI000419F637|nr:dTDP-4-dehydrorhamnose reductase [Bradyrhizobium sp. Tv2a-2]
MRIVLTGVTGQVGLALTVTLPEIGTVVAADRSLLNLAVPATLTAALDRLAPDLIINPAAYTAVDRAEDDRELAFVVNGEAPGVMAKWAAERNVPLIHFSTDYVFDGQGEEPWREDSRTGPLSVYGASKLAGEQVIRDAGGPHLIVRTSWVYAATGSNFLRTIARLARERTELRVVADQVGSPTSANLIAAIVTSLLGKSPGNLSERFSQTGGVLNVAASGQTSWHGFATRIIAGLKARGVELAVRTIVPVRTEEYPTKARRPHNSRLDLTRLRSLIGIEPTPWNEALDHELDLLAAELR